MFELSRSVDGHLAFRGRLDASQAEKTRATLEELRESCTIDFAELEYISSAGLGVLLATQKRLNEAGHRLRLIRLNRHISDVFHIAGFDRVFEIE